MPDRAGDPLRYRSGRPRKITTSWAPQPGRRDGPRSPQFEIHDQAVRRTAETTWTIATAFLVRTVQSADSAGTNCASRILLQRRPRVLWPVNRAGRHRGWTGADEVRIRTHPGQARCVRRPKPPCIARSTARQSEWETLWARAITASPRWPTRCHLAADGGEVITCS